MKTDINKKSKTARFYQQSEIVVGEELVLSAEVHRHAIQVLRLKAGDNLVLFNGDGGEYHAALSRADKRKSLVMVESFEGVSREPSLKTTLALATIKPDKMDFAIQKSVELGVSIIQPLYTARSVIKIKENRLDKKMQHWQGVIIAACEQSGRTKIPELCPPIGLGSFLKDGVNNVTENCIAMLLGDHPNIQNIEIKNVEYKGLTLLIGPEGGFTDEEEIYIADADVKPINFGERVLRAETAAIAGLTVCQQRWGDL